MERAMSSELQALKQELQQKNSQNRQQDEELISAMREQVQQRYNKVTSLQQIFHLNMTQITMYWRCSLSVSTLLYIAACYMFQFCRFELNAQFLGKPFVNLSRCYGSHRRNRPLKSIWRMCVRKMRS